MTDRTSAEPASSTPDESIRTPADSADPVPLEPPEGIENPLPSGSKNPLTALDGPPRRTPINLMSPLRIGFTATVGALLAFGLAQLLIDVRSILILIAVALFIAVGLNPMVEFLMRRGLKRWLGVLTVLIGVVGALVLAGYAVVPLFSAQIGTLVSAGPGILQDTLHNPTIRSVNDRFQIITKAQQFLTSGSLIQQLFGGLLGAGQVVLGAVISGFTVLILSLFFLASLPKIKSAAYRLAPASRRDRVRTLGDEIFRRVGAYLSGMFLVVTVAGICSFVFLTIAGLSQYALALAVVVAMFDFVPLVGPTIAAAIVCVVAFVHSPATGIAAVAYYLVYMQFEAYVIQPRVMKKAVDVPGALVVIAALLGGTLLGVVGALLAVPTAASVLLLLREVAQPRLDAS